VIYFDYLSDPTPLTNDSFHRRYCIENKKVKDREEKQKTYTLMIRHLRQKQICIPGLH
jgi:hypothetical protein